MNIVSTAKLSSVNQTAALISADLAPVKYRTVPVDAPLDTLRAPQAELTLKGNSVAAAIDAPLTFVVAGGGTTLLDDPSVFAVIGKSATAGGPRTNAEAGDIIAKFINGAVNLWSADMPNVDMDALHAMIQRVVRDVCEHFKPGDDLVGQLRAAVGLAMWGAGASAETIADFGDNGIYPSFIQGGPTTPLALGQELYGVEQAWTKIPFTETLRSGALPSSTPVQAFPPAGKVSTTASDVDWIVSRNDPGEVEVVDIQKPNYDGYDKIQNPLASYDGLWSHDASSQLTGSGVADLTLFLQGVWLSDSDRKALHSEIERVVGDVCRKSAPGDDLIGKITAAVGFVLWGKGYQPDVIASVTSSLATALTSHFAGDAETSLEKMGQFFNTHAAGELIPENIDPNDFGL